MGYVSSLIPVYSEVVRHINQLTRKNVPFMWDQKCQDSLNLAKEVLTNPPVLTYLDPNEKYHLFTDASNYTWSAVLMQEREIETPKGKERHFLPIAFHSGTFQGSEVNWAAFQKEAAAIHRGIKQMSFYLYEAHVIVHSDHKPLAKFVEGMTKNHEVNNWTMECHAICKVIEFQYIKGKKNILCDSLTRIQYFDPYEDKEPEKPGHLFGKPDSEGADQEEGYEVLEITHSGDADEPESVQLKVTTKELVDMKRKQQKYIHICKMIEQHPNKLGMLYKVREDDVLVKIVRTINQKSEVVMVPEEMMKYILHEAHKRLGHLDTVKLYLFLRKMYYWPNLKRDCTKQVCTCLKCQQNNLKEPHYIDFTNIIPKFPLSQVALNIMGPFETASSGATCFLTCMCLLAGFLFTVPITDKRAEMVVNAYLRNIYSITGGIKYILSDRGSEFISKTFKEVTKRLQLTQTFTSPRNPKANSILE